MTAPATSLLILTDEESRLIRKALEAYCSHQGEEAPARYAPLEAFNTGMVRGTEKLKAEFAERMKAKRK